jgi:predicted RNase H-like HicB family nuclease
MNEADVTIARDPEDPHTGFLVRARYGPHEYATQGDTVDEARAMALHLLKTWEVPNGTRVRFTIHDETTLTAS